MAWIYVLHFERALHHAQHYTGCTENLPARLRAHAYGTGARLTEVIREQGIEWRLGGLIQCSKRRMRQLERHLKDMKNAGMYCEFCNPTTRRIKGTTPIAIASVTTDTCSETIRQHQPQIEPAIMRPSTPNEEERVMQQIKTMMKADKDALGYIPAGGDEGLQTLIPRGQIILADTSHGLAGYTSFSISTDQKSLKISQCCVADADRMVGNGRRMIQLVRARAAGRIIQAKVREDLAANHFWKAIGFIQTGVERHETSGSKLNVYRTK